MTGTALDQVAVYQLADYFYQSYYKNQFTLKATIEFLDKNSANLAIYKKLTNY